MGLGSIDANLQKWEPFHRNPSKISV